MEAQNQTIAQMPLEQADPHIGDSVQVLIGGSGHAATLIGYLKGKSFMITMPEHGSSLSFHESQPLVMRFTSNQRSYEFSTTVRHVSNQPFPHLHLACPDEVRALQERRHERIKINITGLADIPNGQTLSCVVRDISMGGALIAVDTPTGGISDQLVLTLKVAISGVEYSLSLDSEVRSIRIGDSSGNGSSKVLQGLAFRDLSEKDFLALAAFDLLPDWSASS